MADTKILQAILDRLTALEQAVANGFKNVNERFDKTDNRIDNLGIDLAELSDDAPTVEEFDKLEKRVKKLETRTLTA